MRAPPAPARPPPELGQVGERGRAWRGRLSGGTWARPRGPRAPHASGAERGGLLGLGGGSSLRSGFLLPATVLTRFLEPPSDIYLTSQFSLLGAGWEGWRQGGGRLAEMGSERGNLFFSLHRPRLPRPLVESHPEALDLRGSASPLDSKGNQESRQSTPSI